MTGEGNKAILSDRAAQLRQAFDRSFAEPVRAETRSTVDFIAISLAGDAHAIRMSDIGGLFADVRVTPCPSPVAELRGIAGFRGALTPVYDLAALLGYSMSSGRWMVLARDQALALAFDDFRDHFRIEPAAIAARQGASVSRHVHQIAQQPGRAWPIIDIPSVVAVIKARAAAHSSNKEH
jgi:purine-binding chemotaxis protein CheW